ncbi:LysR family transcriptional regulator [Burkholderia arboris]|nr:LysR family transcriptional regulator [Burkholderia arboris]
MNNRHPPDIAGSGRAPSFRNRCRTGSVTQAAGRLNRSPSAAGAPLKKREDHAGQDVRKRPRYAPGLSPTRSLNNLQNELTSL